jgi:hypothetical protein
MPQNPLNLSTQNPSNAFVPTQADYGGNLMVGKGLEVTFDVTAATVIFTGKGRVAKVSVIVAGSAAGTVNDCATTGAAAVANQLATIPDTAGGGVYDIDMPVATGLVVVPGTGQTLAVSFTPAA